MNSVWRCVRARHAKCATQRRWFTGSATRREIRSIEELPDRIHPKYRETSNHDLLSLRWPQPLRNILMVRKDEDAEARAALIEYATHIHETYPNISVVLEPSVAEELHEQLPFPVFTPTQRANSSYREKIDLTSTLGGDGTILHAASLFATARSAPPILSFSMGTLGFLGEWKFNEYKRAFREVYVSGAPAPLTPRSMDEPVQDITRPQGGQGESAGQSSEQNGWASIRGKHMGAERNSRILMRSRLRIGLFDSDGQRLPHEPPFVHTENPREDIFALNEVLLHRGALPHMSHITILIGSGGNERTLTTAIADGFLVSTPTGSTAYSLSSGGSIVHPLVSSLLLTPICPRSLSFRPLVLPANTPITLRIDAENRGKELEVSIDGVRRQAGLRAGMEVRVVGEEIRTPGKDWVGGVPSIVRSGGSSGEDHWVGGLNSLLKFNYPFGEDG